MIGLVKLLQPLFDWVYRRPFVFPLSIDLGAWTVGLAIGAVLKLAFSVGSVGTELVVLSAAAIVLQGAFGWSIGIYRHRWRVSSFDEISALSSVWLVTAAVLLVGNYVSRQNGADLPSSAVMIGSIAALSLMGATRGAWRRYWERNRRPNPDGCKRTIVFGAGEGASQMIRAMLLDVESEYYPVAMLDDDPQKRNREIEGVRVLGTRNELEAVAKSSLAETILIAIPSATGPLIKDITERANAVGLEIRVLPAASELVGRMTLADVRPPTVEDLLGRDPVEIDLDSVSEYIRGKRVLITGAGGSIGSELSRQVKSFGPSELFFLDRDENALHALQLSLEGRALLDTDTLVVADIRDRDRIFDVFDEVRPQVVFHTAALKHLTLLENHPEEGMKTNTVGSLNLLEASRKHGVDCFVNISTDKAADPSSVLGASKLAAERLTAQMGRETGLRYVSVRFGNVLGSRGSVLPTFLGQIEQGEPITVTHPDVTRYFMTIPEAVRLVVQAGAIGAPGEVMILDMGEPVRIVDLAQQLINSLAPGREIEFTGLRPGEKLHEVLIAETERGEAREHPRITHTQSELLGPAEAYRSISDASVHQISGMLADTSSWNILGA